MIRVLGVGLVAALAPQIAWAQADETPPLITHVRIADAERGAALTIRAKIDDDSAVFAPSVYVRPEGRTEFDAIDMKLVGDAYEAIVPAEQLLGNVEYFIEAFDEHGNGPAREGSPEAPIAVLVRVAEPPPPPVLVPVDEGESDDPGLIGEWWLWTIIGVVVVGGAVGAYFALKPPSEVDMVEAVIMGPDPTGGLP